MVVVVSLSFVLTTDTSRFFPPRRSTVPRSRGRCRLGRKLTARPLVASSSIVPKNQLDDARSAFDGSCEMTDSAGCM